LIHSGNRNFGRFPKLLSLTLGAIQFLFAAAFAARAQETASTPQQAIKSTSTLVRLNASVMDANGHFVEGLEAKDFRVLDSGAPQPILFFAPVDAPANVLVVVETSPAVYLFHEQHIAAAYALLDGLAPDDEVALASYDSTLHAMLNFTQEKPALLATLQRIQYGLGMGDLNFYDCVSTAVDWVPPAASKRALVLLTTGLDSSSPARWDALVEKLRGDDVVIYSVALGGSLRTPSPPPKKSKSKKGSKNESPQPTESASASASAGAQQMSFAKANDALNSLAAITGGRAYFPAGPEEFVAIYREIAAALRHQYVLGIAPAQDGQYHALTVQVLRAHRSAATSATPDASQKVYARQGYLAPKP
jgi:VWFA-related protein